MSTTRFSPCSEAIIFDPKDGLLWGKSPDCVASQKEGWDLFLHTGKGEFEIEAITDLEEVGCSQHDAIGRNDDEIVNAVIERAMQGSRRHLLALYLDGRQIMDKGVEIWVPTKLVHKQVIDMIDWQIEANGDRRDVFETVKKVRAIIQREIEECERHNDNQKAFPRSQRRKMETRFLRGNLILLRKIESELTRDNSMVPADQWYYLIRTFFDENDEHGMLINSELGKRLMAIVMGITR